MAKGKPHNKRVLDVSRFSDTYRSTHSIDGSNELFHQGITSVDVEKLVDGGLIGAESLMPRATLIRLCQLVELTAQSLIEQRRLREVIEEALKH